MRGFGILVLVLGVLAAMGAMMMDVSVPSGVGRVNNLGLIAERQNYIIIGCVMLIAGLLMTMLGRRQAAPALDSKTCPMCAENIKKAAIKCKHCGADIVDNDLRTIESNEKEPTSYSWAKGRPGDSGAVLWMLSVTMITIILFLILSRL